MNAARRVVRFIALVANGGWQCSQCSKWFGGSPSQTCPACS